MKDHRLPENRMQAFIRSYHWRRYTGDLDHTHFCQVICDELDLNMEQRIWFSLLFGHSYRAPMALIFIQEFPDPKKLKIRVVQDWIDKNYHRLIYAKDTRYQKSKLPIVIKGIQDWLQGETLVDTIDRIVQYKDSKKNFYGILKAIRLLPQFGRMTAWLAMQCLYDVCKLNIDYRDLLIHDNGSWSPYNGLCILWNEEKLQRTKSYKPSKSELDYMMSNLNITMDLMQRRLPYKDIDIFRMETHLCEFRKWSIGKEYLGWNSAEQNELYIKYKRNFPDYDLKPFLKALMTLDSSIRGLRSDKRFFTEFGNSGMLIHLNKLYPNMPNVFKIRGWKKKDFRIKEMFEDWDDDLKYKSPSDYDEFKPT